MVASAPILHARHNSPHTRPMNAWRDGRAVADLLELAFKDEPFDEGGRRLLHMLRHFGPFEAASLEGSRSFIWDENGQIMGNVSIAQNPTRKNTWVVGNVATHPDQRGRGIATALMQAAIDYAQKKRGRFAALQVVDGNMAATHLYDKLGFSRVGLASYYQRASVHSLPVSSTKVFGEEQIVVRPAQISDASFVWAVSRRNIPDDLTYSEPFDAAAHHPGLIWRLDNFLNGSPEHWFVAEKDGVSAGAIRTQINYDGCEHVMELMLDENAPTGCGRALIRAALLRLEKFSSRPINAMQSHPNPASHVALQEMGFGVTRALAHMKLAL